MRHIVKGTPDPVLEARRIQHLVKIATGTDSNQDPD